MQTGGQYVDKQAYSVGGWKNCFGNQTGSLISETDSVDSRMDSLDMQTDILKM